MSKASKMIQTMDQLQITQKPYKAHYLTECDQIIRQQYLQLLFSVVSLEGFNDAQQRIWQLLSQSIGVDGTSSDEMTSELIQNVVQSCVVNKLQHVFVLDLLVLLRLNAVSEEQARILAELISLFALSDTDVDTLIHLSDLILNLSDKGQNLTEFKYETIRHWHEFSYQVLTKELLIAGLNKGRWIQLNDILEVSKPINIQNSSLYCMGEKVISVTNHPIKIKASQIDVNLKAENCDLEILETNFANQSIELLGDQNKAFFEDCNFARVFEASYDDPIYLNCIAGNLTFNKCNFQMENIATINFTGEKLIVENSHFEKCGSPKGNGAVTVHSSQLNIQSTIFQNCFAKNLGGAVTARNQAGNAWYMKKNVFINCVGSPLVYGEQELFMGVFFYLKVSDSRDVYNFIHDCEFNKSNLILSLIRNGGRTGADNRILNSKFIDSTIICQQEPERIKLSNCEFENNNKSNPIAIWDLINA